MEAAKKKTTAAKKPAQHPAYKEMVVEALRSLHERNGSSRQKISQYLVQNFKCSDDAVKRHLKLALKKMLVDGAIIQSKGVGASGSFKLAAKKPAAKPVKKAATKKPAPAKKAVAKKPAAKPKAAAKSPKKPKSKVAKKPKAVKKSPAKKSAAPPKPRSLLLKSLLPRNLLPRRPPKRLQRNKEFHQQCSTLAFQSSSWSAQLGIDIINMIILLFKLSDR
eukprot:gene2940-biopygen2601